MVQASSTAEMPAEGMQLNAPDARVPGGFWRRVLAAIIDGAIYSVVSFPLSFLFAFAIGMTGAMSGGDPQANSTMTIVLTLGSYLVSFVVMFFYYGWFYKNKGATPGKMLMRLRVSYADTGTHLSYWRTFGRETIGKMLSSMLLFIGFLMAGFRSDKRGLHDFMFKTQVTYEPK